jgi:integron integrase
MDVVLSPQAGGGKPKKKLLDQVRDVLRLKHYSLRTERAYCDWITRFIRFHRMRHPAEMREAEMSEFLTDLARSKNVSAATQNQALSALLFLYKEVLKQEIGWLQNVERAKKPARLPVVLTRDEVHKVFAHLHGTARLMVGLLYGSGLRLMECVRLRVKDIDFGYARITVRDAKSGRDRVTMLPINLAAPLQLHLQKVKLQHDQDLADGFGEVWLPDALARKYPRAAREWSWQFVFPSSRISIDPRTKIKRRHQHRRKRTTTGGQKGRALNRINQTCKLPYVSPLIRNASVRKRLRHPHSARIVGTQRRDHDNDLHPCAEQAGHRSKKSAGLANCSPIYRLTGICFPNLWLNRNRPPNLRLHGACSCVSITLPAAS